jgi:hypothetical protein
MAKYEVTVRYITYDVIDVEAENETQAKTIAMQNCLDVPDVENSAFTVEAINIEELEP